MAQYLQKQVTWKSTGQAEFPYAARVEGARWKIRLNDYPAEIMYSLLVDDNVVAEFDDWPSRWKR